MACHSLHEHISSHAWPLVDQDSNQHYSSSLMELHTCCSRGVVTADSTWAPGSTGCYHLQSRSTGVSQRSGLWATAGAQSLGSDPNHLLTKCKTIQPAGQAHLDADFMHDRQSMTMQAACAPGRKRRQVNEVHNQLCCCCASPQPCSPAPTSIVLPTTQPQVG
jgi:hypothetical protein